MKPLSALFTTFVPGQNSGFICFDDVDAFIVCLWDDGSGCEGHSGAMEKARKPMNTCRSHTQGGTCEALLFMSGGRHGLRGETGLGGLLALVGQLRPDALPVVRPEVLSGELSSALLFDTSAIWDRDARRSPSVDRLAREAKSAGETRLEPRSVKKHNPFVHGP